MRTRIRTLTLVGLVAVASVGAPLVGGAAWPAGGDTSGPAAVPHEDLPADVATVGKDALAALKAPLSGDIARDTLTPLATTENGVVYRAKSVRAGRECLVVVHSPVEASVGCSTADDIAASGLYIGRESEARGFAGVVLLPEGARAVTTTAGARTQAVLTGARVVRVDGTRDREVLSWSTPTGATGAVELPGPSPLTASRE